MKKITIRVNGNEIPALHGQTLAAAMLNAGVQDFRPEEPERPRLPFCAMGVCMECTATVDGRPAQRTCLVMCEDGMEVELV